MEGRNNRFEQLPRGPTICGGQCGAAGALWVLWAGDKHHPPNNSVPLMVKGGGSWRRGGIMTSGAHALHQGGLSPWHKGCMGTWLQEGSGARLCCPYKNRPGCEILAVFAPHFRTAEGWQ